MRIKKAYLAIIAILIALVSIILIIKLVWPKESEEAKNSKAEVASFTPASQPTISADEKVSGSAKAAIKIIVYEDYSNIFSADNAENIKKLENEFGNKIGVAVRPYATRLKPLSLEAAMAVECASEQGKWEEMREGIFNVVRVNSLNEEGINGWAKQINLDMDKFNKCLTDTEKQGIMLQVVTDAQKFSVYGAPTVFINEELIVGARPYDDYTDEAGASVLGLKSLVAKELAK